MCTVTSHVTLTHIHHTCGITHSYVWHDSFTYVRRLIHVCDTTYAYGTHHTTRSAPCDMTYPPKYGVASISRLIKIIALFCKRALWKRRFSAKETYNFKEPSNRSHPLACPIHADVHLDITCTRRLYMTWPIHIYDTSHSHIWHVSFIHMTRLIHIHDMIQTDTRCLIHVDVCNIKYPHMQHISSAWSSILHTRPCMWRGSFI